MFQIEMLPAAHGDALWIEFGPTSKPHRILIDAGPVNAYDDVHARLAAATATNREIELFVITHIDTDHIDGAVLLLRDKSLKLDFKDIWFNAWPQIAPQSGAADIYGAEQGEFVAALIDLDHRPWNRAFDGGAIGIPETGELPEITLAGDAKLTILSPGDRQLRRLRRNWDSVISDAGWNAGDVDGAMRRLTTRKEYLPPMRRESFGADEFGTDNAVANGSSIAFVLEHDGVRCLFTGDAFADVLEEGLRRYAAKNQIAGRVGFDVVKLPHHGSQKNWSAGLHQLLTSERFLISTGGARFKHPDAETIDLILREEPRKQVELWFNYLSKTTEPWKIPPRRATSGTRFTSHYPTGPGKSVVVQVKK